MPAEPAGVPSVVTDHIVPLNSSASGASPVEVKMTPAAMHVVPAQDTEVRIGSFDVPSAGIGSMLQPWPSQCSTSEVCCVKLLSAASPTAVQSDGDTQDTAWMPRATAPAGSGRGGCTVQLMPFHFSNSTPGVR